MAKRAAEPSPQSSGFGFQKGLRPPGLAGWEEALRALHCLAVLSKPIQWHSKLKNFNIKFRTAVRSSRVQTIRLSRVCHLGLSTAFSFTLSRAFKITSAMAYGRWLTLMMNELFSQWGGDSPTSQRPRDFVWTWGVHKYSFLYTYK